MNKFKKFIYTLFNKKPGRRFLLAYRATNHYVSDNLIIKIGIMLAGIFSVFIGFIFFFIPGPGIIFVLMGLVLLCATSKRIATSLDNLEKNINDYFYVKK